VFDRSLLRAYVDVARLAPSVRRQRRKPRGVPAIPLRGAPSIPGLRIALVHDYLVHVRGGERVFQVLCETFPTADVFSLVYRREEMPDYFWHRGVATSFVQRLPMSRRRFRAYLPLYPLAARCLNLREYDLVIASSSAWVHGVNVGDKTTLVCYCYSPFRFIWSHYGSLVKERAGALAAATRPFAAVLRSLDRRAARRVDQYVAISRVVQSRIRAFYGRDSVLVPPPVDLDVFRPSGTSPSDYLLVVSALMRYKRIDIAVEACTRLMLRLKVVGAGDDEARLRRIAGPTVEFLGQLPDPEVARLYQGCRAFLFTADEDFGITPLEAMASGRPVVALAAGGALETVVEGGTGLFFSEPTADALAAVLQGETFEGFDPARIRRHAESFGVPAFQEMVRGTVDAALKARSRRA
jgi:glycosyltransferase involved in cell wall biosynthesis